MQTYSLYIDMIVINLVGLIIAFHFYNHLLVKKNTIKGIKVLSLFVTWFIAIIINVVVSKFILLLFCLFLFYFFIAIFFYSGKVHMKMIISIFSMIISLLMELLTALLLTAVFGEIIVNIREDKMFLLIGGIISKLMLLLVVEIIIRYKNRNVSKISIGSWVLIISIPCISIFLSIFEVYKPLIDNEYSVFSAFSCIALLYINLIAFHLFDNIVEQVDTNNKLRFKEEQLLLQKEQYENVIVGYNKVKKIRHDMIGHLIVVESYLTNLQYNKAISYIGRLSDEIDIRRSGVISNNVVVDAIINNRMEKARGEGIKFDYEVKIPNKLEIDDMDLCIILGNILNNAIESCMRLSNGNNKWIELNMKYKREILFIEVKNSYDINTIRKISNKFISSKRKRTKKSIGMGIDNVEAIALKYNGECQIKLSQEMFIIKIMLLHSKQK